ncbi:diacylglycerol/lipid kinase family protein [Halalkalibacillus sediminis]|nr:YegS/Rv2252/BmrU family lipid kinase [Halalkalibacillus sediminis]
MHYDRALFIFNGNKDDNEVQPMIKQVAPELITYINDLTIKQTHSEEDLKDACNSSNKYDLLIIYGGDGTLHTAINVLAAMDETPVIMLLPGGTCNDFSRALGIPQNIKNATSTLQNNRVEEIDVSAINDNYFMNFAGAGLITEASENIDDQLKQTFGKISYFLSAVQTFQQGGTKRFHLVVDGEEHEVDAVMVIVMNGCFIGTHHLPINSISVKDELLDVIVVRESNMKTIKEWLSLSNLTSDNKDLDQITHFQGKKISISADSSLEVDTDGEIYMETPIEIKMNDQPLKFLVGENFGD